MDMRKQRTCGDGFGGVIRQRGDGKLVYAAFVLSRRLPHARQGCLLVPSRLRLCRELYIYIYIYIYIYMYIYRERERDP